MKHWYFFHTVQNWPVSLYKLFKSTNNSISSEVYSSMTLIWNDRHIKHSSRFKLKTVTKINIWKTISNSPGLLIVQLGYFSVNEFCNWFPEHRKQKCKIIWLISVRKRTRRIINSLFFSIFVQNRKKMIRTLWSCDIHQIVLLSLNSVQYENFIGLNHTGWVHEIEKKHWIIILVIWWIRMICNIKTKINQFKKKCSKNIESENKSCFVEICNRRSRLNID